MTSRHYRLRLHGLDSPSGTIRARELHEVLSALLATSERAVRGEEELMNDDFGFLNGRGREASYLAAL